MVDFVPAHGALGFDGVVCEDKQIEQAASAREVDLLTINLSTVVPSFSSVSIAVIPDDFVAVAAADM